MQSEAPEQMPPAPEEDALSQSNKRRRTSERSGRTLPESSESSHAPSTGRRTLTTSSPQRGSSREMTPPQGTSALTPIRYTRTGRVSKASKGQRVHHCEECEKTYTRAEHLRRHQQNHKPGAFPCDVPGCGRSFYREDLLTRHKARHNDPLNPPSRPTSPGSPDSAHSAQRSSESRSRQTTVLQPTNSTHTQVEVTATPPASGRNSSRQAGNSRYQFSASFRKSQPPSICFDDVTERPKEYLDITQLNRTNHGIPVSLTTSGYHPELTFGGIPWDASPPYSPGYDSPTNNDLGYTNGPPYYQPHPARARHSSNASYLGQYGPYNTSRSPVSAGSSTFHLPQWGHSALSAGFQQLSTPSGSEGSYGSIGGMYNGIMMDDHLLLGGSSHPSRGPTLEERDLMESNDLIVPTSTVHGSSLDLTLNSLDEATYTNEERYLTAYWLRIHPLFPVVHRPSFTIQTASPLLRAAILALGAHALGDAADKTNARQIHERCLKVLKNRTSRNWHSYRVCDLQAVVLVEIYAIFKSRRPPLQFSSHFEDVYSCLVNDPDALNADLANDTPMQGNASDGSGSFDDFSDASNVTLQARCKQRLFLACYILDQQHATLFGRPRTSYFSGTAMDLPFPQSQASWDLINEPRQDEPTYTRLWQALDGGNMDQPAQQHYDLFQSMLMLACLSDTCNDSDPFSLACDPDRDLPPILSTMEQSSRVTLTYHTFMLCKHTPIRDLLAVAGESWVMAEKLSKPSYYMTAQILSGKWAGGHTDPNLAEFALDQDWAPVERALKHALKILELHRNHSRTGLLFQEWSVYLASVVVWARAYVLSTERRPSHGHVIPSHAEARLSAFELEQATIAVIAAGPNGHVSMNDAKNVLSWSKAKIEKVDMDVPHNCGLTNGALDVLGKLVARGHESGWFGS